MVGHLANHGGINNHLCNRMEGLSPNDLNPDQGEQNFCLSCRNAPILICAINKPFGSCHTYLSGTFRLSRGGGNGKIWHPLEHSSAPKLLGDPVLLLFLSVGNYWRHQQLRQSHPVCRIFKEGVRVGKSNCTKRKELETCRPSLSWSIPQPACQTKVCSNER